MPFRSQNTNPVRQLVELKTSVRESNAENGSRHDLEVGLGVFQDEVDIDKVTIAVGIKKAILSVDLEGMEIVDGSKFGLDIAPARTSTKTCAESTVQTAVETAVAAEAIAAGEIGALSATGKLSVNASGKQTQSASASLKTTRESAAEHVTVKAVGNDMWRVTELDEAVLDRTYLSEQPLCAVRPVRAKPNRQHIEVTVFAKEKEMDVSITRDDRLIPRSKAKDRIVGILVAKALHELNGSKDYEGVVTFSRSKVEHED